MRIRKKCNHIVVDVPGDLKIEHFMPLKNQIKNLLASGIHFIDFNLQMTSEIDSNNLTFLLNTSKTLNEKGGRIGLFNVSKSIEEAFASIHLLECCRIFLDEAALDQFIINSQERKSGFDYFPYTTPVTEKFKKLPLKCTVCGSIRVNGYMVFPKNKQLEWRGLRLLPSFSGLGNEKDEDFYRIMAIVCPDCFMASIYPEDFALIKGDKEVLQPRFDESVRALYVKGISKRKKMIALKGELNPTAFEYPRTDLMVTLSFTLAEECVRSISSERSKCDPLAIAYLNTLLAEYVNGEEKAKCYDRARTWCVELIGHPQSQGIFAIAQAHYLLMVACMMLGKKKEAKETFEQFKKYSNNLKDNFCRIVVNFWLEHGQRLWIAYMEAGLKSIKGRKKI